MFKTIALRTCGAWGTRKLRESILGRAPSEGPPALRKFMEFVSLIHQNFHPRMVKLPVFSDGSLQRLSMPVLAILGGKDVLLDSVETKRRLEHNVGGAEIRYLPESGHAIGRQTAPILEFLLRCSNRKSVARLQEVGL